MPTRSSWPLSWKQRIGRGRLVLGPARRHEPGYHLWFTFALFWGPHYARQEPFHVSLTILGRTVEVWGGSVAYRTPKWGYPSDVARRAT